MKLYNNNRLKRLQYEFGETNLNSDELVSREYRREINKKYKEKQDIFMIDSVLNNLDSNIRRMIKQEVYQICSSVRLKDLCYNCKIDVIIAIIILYVWKTRYTGLRVEQTGLWNMYNLSWRKYALVMSRLLQKTREQRPIKRVVE